MLDTTQLQRTAATMLRRTPAIMERLLTAVSMVLVVSWHRWQVAVAERRRSMRRVMVLTGQAVAPIPAVIHVDHQDVHLDLVSAQNRSVH